MSKSIESVSRSLLRRFPQDEAQNFDEIWATAEAEGVDPGVVLARLQDLYAEIREQEGIEERWINPEHLRVIDLRGLTNKRMRIKSSGWSVTEDERHQFGDTEYLLVREAENEHDRQALGVYGKGRHVGYVSAVAAARLSPELDKLCADAFLVTGAGPVSGSSRLWVDLPLIGPLRDFVRASLSDG